MFLLHALLKVNESRLEEDEDDEEEEEEGAQVDCCVSGALR